MLFRSVNPTNSLKANDSVKVNPTNSLKANDSVKVNLTKPNDAVKSNGSTKALIAKGLKDSLFWCLYILKNGWFDFEVENRHFTVEKETKFKYIDCIKTPDIKAKLKMHKLTPFNKLEEDLAYNPQISLKTFAALCMIENINVKIVDEETTSWVWDVNNPVHVISKRNGQWNIA